MRFSFFLILVVATFAVSCFDVACAKEEVVIKSFPEMWKGAFTEVMADNAFNPTKLRGQAQTIPANKWQVAVRNIQAGKLNNLDTANAKWKSAFTKLKATGQLKKVDETQVATLTEGVAKEIAKAPEKSSKLKIFLEITFGAALTGLIVVGINSMVSS